MNIYRLKHLQDYHTLQSLTSKAIKNHSEYLLSLIPSKDGEFLVEGYSYVASKTVDFICDFKCSSGYPYVNWRERVVCPITGLNNRMRASINFIDLFSSTHQASSIYIMEQATPMYSYLKERQPNLIGSEFLGDSVPYGHTDNNDFRNEDVTQLSFNDATFDAIFSFDVLEHVFDYRKAFSECARVLRPDGCMIFTVPFALNSSENINRATINSKGEIQHLMEPEYHGDPLSGDGILCYRHYGWSVLRDLHEAGFRDAYVAIFNSIPFGYYTNQVILYAQK